MRVIAFAYDADHHCFDCTFKYVRQGILSEVDDLVREFLRVGSEIELEFEPKDSEGNPIHPIFDTDEWQQFTGEVETLNCSDCSDEIDRYEP